MICPNCNYEFLSGSQCPKCKLDAVLFSGTVKISDVLYNRGLSKIKAGDMSGASENLMKSIEINKNNLLARNLLGLVMYETGHVGEALKHWVISNSLVKENNPAALYIDETQKSGRNLERFNDAIRMYNRALEDIRQKSDDMATIQLKKAIDLNPKFIDALNLLTLCYLIQRDREKAAQTVERVLSLDSNNTIALNYYNELFPGRIKPDLRSRKPAVPSPPTPAPSQQAYQRVNVREKKSTNFHIAEILSFIIGAACMFAALYVLVMPAITRENDKRVSEYQQRLIVNEETAHKETEDQNKIITEREQTITELQAEIDNLSNLYDIQERTNRIINAYCMLTDNKLQEAIDIVTDIDTNGLASDIVEKAENVRAIAYPKLAQTYFDDGVRAYDKEKDYAKALVDLEKSFRYVADDASYMPDLLYYLGFTYALEDETAEKAKDLLTTLVENYPKYKRIKDVNQKLNTLG